MGRKKPAVLAHLGQDIPAGAVLGVESVPDGLATGLLAGVNPLAGLNGYMVGTVAGALATSSAFMAVQGTGAMAILVADVDAVHDATDPARALFTLSMLTGVVMVAAGLLRLGSVLRFVSNAVMVGFINAVGVNIVLGQLGEPHRVRLSSRFASHPRPRHGPAPGSARRTVGRDRSRHDRADRRIGTDAPRSPRPRRRHRRHLGSRERARLGRRDGR